MGRNLRGEIICQPMADVNGGAGLFLSSANQAVECLAEVRVREAETGALQVGGNHAGAIEHVLREFAERELQRGAGYGKEGGPAERGGERSREFGIANRIRRHCVPHAGDFVVHGVSKNLGDVIDVDPGHPLFAGAEFAAEEGFERGHHLCECPAFLPQNKADANLDDAETQAAGAVGFGFPGAAGIGEKPCTWDGGLGEDFIAAIAIDANGGGADEDLRFVADFFDAVNDVAGADHAGVVNAALYFGVPALGDVFTGEVDDAIHPVEAFKRRLAGEGIPNVRGDGGARVASGLAGEDADVVGILQQTIDDVAADKSGTAGDETFHS